MEKALALQIMDTIRAAETQVNIVEALSVKITMTTGKRFAVIWAKS